jgi:hypothetical protein
MPSSLLTFSTEAKLPTESTNWGQSCIDTFCSVHLSMTVRLGLEAAKVCPLRKQSRCAQGSEVRFPLSLPHTVHDHKQLDFYGALSSKREP